MNQAELDPKRKNTAAEESSSRDELTRLVDDTGEELMLDYYNKISEALERQKVFSELDQHGEVPLEFWTACAQVLADASGYSVTLQAALLEPLQHASGESQIVGHREVAVAEPNLFVRKG